MSHNRRKNKNNLSLTRKWQIFLLTSCLTTALQDRHAPLLHDTSPAEGGITPSTLPEDQHRLLQSSINEIVDEFFSVNELLIPSAYAKGTTPTPTFTPTPTPTPTFTP